MWRAVSTALRCPIGPVVSLDVSSLPLTSASVQGVEEVPPNPLAGSTVTSLSTLGDHLDPSLLPVVQAGMLPLAPSDALVHLLLMIWKLQVAIQNLSRCLPLMPELMLLLCPLQLLLRVE